MAKPAGGSTQQMTAGEQKFPSDQQGGPADTHPSDPNKDMTGKVQQSPVAIHPPIFTDWASI